MATVAFIATDDFEDVELTSPRDALQDAGHDVVFVGTDAGAQITGKRGEATVTTDRAAADVSADDFDALVVPGGYSPDKLRIDEDAVSFTTAFFDANKPVAAICHAGHLLAEAKVVQGRKLTSWPSVRNELELSGAEWVDEEVVVDGNLVTSRNPDDLPAFNAALLEQL